MSTFLRGNLFVRTFDWPFFVFLAGAATVFVFVWALIPIFPQLKPESSPCHHNQPHSGFSDDPRFGYTIHRNMENWDNKRRTWFHLDPSFTPNSQDNVFIVTGGPPTPCESPIGDHYLLRTYRNKVDYCRIHGYDIFYKNLNLDSNVHAGWAKLRVVRALLMAHPEVEWIWWLDEVTVITDMEYKIPFHQYKDYNFVLYGWPKEIYLKKRWLGLNAGSFLIRNSQWSLDFLDMWADMGPHSPYDEKWWTVMSDELKKLPFDQTALAYLIWKTQNESFGRKILIETETYLEEYSIDIIDTLNNITKRYLDIEKREGMLRRRHAEKVSEQHGVLREPFLASNEVGNWRRPFFIHFAGCQPCNRKHNPLFHMEGCLNGMNAVLKFADNQVLRNYGIDHQSLDNSLHVSPLSSDYPA